MPEKLLTVQETAEYLRVSRSTIWRWCQDGTLASAFKIGRTWRIHDWEVEEIVSTPQNNEGTPEVEPPQPLEDDSPEDT